MVIQEKIVCCYIAKPLPENSALNYKWANRLAQSTKFKGSVLYPSNMMPNPRVWFSHWQISWANKCRNHNRMKRCHDKILYFTFIPFHPAFFLYMEKSTAISFCMFAKILFMTFLSKNRPTFYIEAKEFFTSKFNSHFLYQMVNFARNDFYIWKRNDMKMPCFGYFNQILNLFRFWKNRL